MPPWWPIKPKLKQHESLQNQPSMIGLNQRSMATTPALPTSYQIPTVTAEPIDTLSQQNHHQTINTTNNKLTQHTSMISGVMISHILQSIPCCTQECQHPLPGRQLTSMAWHSTCNALIPDKLPYPSRTQHKVDWPPPTMHTKNLPANNPSCSTQHLQ